jgi:hypothetical protein
MSGPLLGARGEISITRTAVQTYATKRRLPVEEARSELTALLLEARCTREATATNEVAHYRARSRATQLDISATVVHQGPLHVVLSVNVRDYR